MEFLRCFHFATFKSDFSFPRALEVVRSFAELSQTLSNLVGELRKLSGSEEDQCDHEDKESSVLPSESRISANTEYGLPDKFECGLRRN